MMGVVDGDIAVKRISMRGESGSGWLRGKAKDGEKDNQKGQLIKGDQKP